jgi:hypothetical protein
LTFLLVTQSRIDHLLVWNGDVAGRFLKVESAYVGEWRVQNLLPVLESSHFALLHLASSLEFGSLLADCFVELNGTRVVDLGDTGNVIVTKSIDVHSVVLV